MTEFRYEDEWQTVTVERSPELDQKIADMVFDWFGEVGMFDPESLGQSDTTFIDGPIMIMNLAELIDFDMEYHDD